MKFKKIIKKKLFDIKLFVAGIPMLKRVLQIILLAFPSLYKTLQNIELQDFSHLNFSSKESKKIFLDIKRNITANKS